MKFGWPISLLAHIAFFGVGYFSFYKNLNVAPESRIIPVEMITVSELTNIKAAIKRPEPEPEPVKIPEPEEPMQLVQPMENAPEAGDPKTVPADIPEPVQPQEVVPDPQAEDVLEVPDEAPRPPAFDLDALAGIVDKSRETQPQANQQVALQSERNIYDFEDVSRAGSGLGTALTLSEMDALRSAMYKCWRIPLDAKNPEELNVRVQVKLRSDGEVIDVKLLDQNLIAMSSNPYLPVAAQRAVAAVTKCAPYDFLPVSKYSTWRDITLRFNPEI